MESRHLLRLQCRLVTFCGRLSKVVPSSVLMQQDATSNSRHGRWRSRENSIMCGVKCESGEKA